MASALDKGRTGVTFPPPAAATSVVGRTVVAVIAGLLALSPVWGGTARADPPQDNDAQQGPSDIRKRLDLRRTQQRQIEEDKKLAAEMDSLLKEMKEMDAPAQLAAMGSVGGIPTMGMGGLVPKARALAGYISANYPGVQAIGGVRADPLPDHPSGHAIDIMIGSDMGLGDAINADVQRQAERFGVAYSLWRVANHFNHVHVTVF